MADKEETQKDGNDEKTRTPALEWLFAAIGLLMVASVIGFLCYEIATNNGNPPNLNVKIEEIVQNEQGFLVKFIVANTGDETAADVTVEGTIKTDSNNEKTSVTIDYVPSHSEKKGGMFFKENPHGTNFEIRATGYNQP